MTIEEGKEYLLNNFENGVICPCCKQIVKLNTYTMSYGHAKVMADMFRLHKNGQDWVHVNADIKPQGRQFSEAKHWFLIEPMKGKVAGKHTSGYWRLTESGKRFVRNEIRVQKYVKVFNDKRYHKYENDNITVNIKEAFGNKFDYDSLGYENLVGASQGALL